MNDKRKKNN